MQITPTLLIGDDRDKYFKGHWSVAFVLGAISFLSHGGLLFWFHHFQFDARWFPQKTLNCKQISIITLLALSNHVQSGLQIFVCRDLDLHWQTRRSRQREGRAFCGLVASSWDSDLFFHLTSAVPSKRQSVRRMILLYYQTSQDQQYAHQQK